MSAIYPENFEQKIGFDRIRQFLSSNCLSSLGKERVDDISFSSNYNKICYDTQLVVEFLIVLREHDSFPTNHYFDMRQALAKIRIVGTYLEVFELFDLKRSLDSQREMVDFFGRCNEAVFPNLKKLAKEVATFPQISKRIDQLITKHGSIKDNASPTLSDIRRQIFSIQSTVTRRLQSIIRQLQQEGIVEEDTTAAIRDGRPVIPVLSAKKKRINGIIHDESATGKTAFIEPAEIVEMNNHLRELEYAEMREIVKILTEFSTEIRPEVDNLLGAYHFVGEIDFIRAKAQLAIQFECIKPTIDKDPFFDWQHSRHPLLTKALKKENREVIPLSLRLFEPNRIVLISGPNAGGKSVCLKTVGIIQYMLQCGLLVPMVEGSKVGIFDKIFIDIGDEQSIDNDLSTYSSHLLNMKHFVKNCNARSLVLIDEFGTGTEPMLGGAIAEAVLNHINKAGTYGVITTHYTNLKHFATSNEGVINGAMLYDSNGMRPLFKLQIGSPGSSFAFEIARKIGLPEEILKEATEKVGQEHIDFDKNLREIVRDKQYWETKRNKVHRVEKELDEMSLKYKTELEESARLRKEIVQQAKKEAQDIIKNANKLIENTIREIKESSAEKEKTKILRNTIQKVREELAVVEVVEDERIANKMRKIQQNESRIKTPKPEKTKLKTALISEKQKFSPGDKVQLKGQGNVGEIIDIDGSKVVIAFGHLLSNMTIDKIEHVSNNDIKKREMEERLIPKKSSLLITNRIGESKLSFKSEIDLRGVRADEAIERIKLFIDEAIVVNCSNLRILHGKGYGILREVIREYLKSEPYVRSFRDEHIQFGGAGITVVELG